MNKLKNNNNMTLVQLKELLKSRKFVSVNRLGQNFTFNFTESHIFRDDAYLCDYDLSEENGNYHIKFVNLHQNIWTGDFKNVLLVCGDIKMIINADPFLFNGKCEIRLDCI